MRKRIKELEDSGEIGGHSGQTPESYEEWSAPCPDCSPAAIAAQRKEG